MPLRVVLAYLGAARGSFLDGQDSNLATPGPAELLTSDRCAPVYAPVLTV
jgi:hypothetical protein